MMKTSRNTPPNSIFDAPEKVETCQYCDGSERRLMSGGDDPYETFNYITFTGGKAFIHDADMYYIPIKACPMCGRKFAE